MFEYLTLSSILGSPGAVSEKKEPSFIQSWLTWQKSHGEWELINKLHHDLDESIPNGALESIWIDFIKKKEWREGFKEIVKKIIQGASLIGDNSEFIRQIQKVNWYQDYSILASLFRSINRQYLSGLYAQLEPRIIESSRQKENKSTLYALREYKKQVAEYEEKLEKKNFNKCLCVMGQAGSGKTHFINSLLVSNELSQFDENAPLLFLPIKKIQGKTLGQMIQEQIYTLTGMDNPSQLFESLDRIHHNCKIIITIDNLGQWRKSDVTFYEGFKELVSSFTKYKRVYWLITLKAANYYVANDGWSFLKDYSFQKHKPSKFVLGNVWYLLDEYNFSQRLGIKLLKQQLGLHSAFSVAIDNLDESKTCFKQFCSPFIAWLLYEIRDSIDIETLADLHLTCLIEKFKDKHLKSETISTLSLEFGIESLSDLFLSSGKNRYNEIALMNGIRAKALDKSELADKEKLETMMTVINEMDLICIDEDPQLKERMVSLTFDIFWSYAIAKNLMDHKISNFNKMISMEIAMDEWTCKFKNQEIKEGALIFFLLNVDSDEKISEKSKTKIWNAAIDWGFFKNHCVWFAAYNAFEVIQENLCQRLEKGTFRAVDKQDLFALMCFLSDSTVYNSKIDRKFYILQRHFSLIKESHLNDYYQFCAEKNLFGIKDAIQLLNSIQYFDGCEILGVEARIALCVIEKLTHLYGADSFKMLDFIVDALAAANENQGIKNFKRQSAHYKGEFHRLFLDWVLYHFLDFIVLNLGMYSVDLLDQKKWFFASKLGISSNHLGERMEREATIKLGFYYRNVHMLNIQTDEGGAVQEDETAYELEYHDNVYRQAFEEKTYNLCSSKNPHDRRIGFYMIQHTLARRHFNTLALKKNLRDPISTLYREQVNNPFIFSRSGNKNFCTAQFKLWKE